MRSHLSDDPQEGVIAIRNALADGPTPLFDAAVAAQRTVTPACFRLALSNLLYSGEAVLSVDRVLRLA